MKEDITMKNKNGSRKNSALALSFTAGSLIGAAAGLLLAPWEGRQARGKLKEFGEEVKETSIRLSNNWKEKAVGFMEKRKNSFPPEKDNLTAGHDAKEAETGVGKEIPLAPEGHSDEDFLHPAPVFE